MDERFVCLRCDSGPLRVTPLIEHVRGAHGLDVNSGHCNRSKPRAPHFAYCNECERQNGHGRRLHNAAALVQHLEVIHGIHIAHERRIERIEAEPVVADRCDRRRSSQ